MVYHYRRVKCPNCGEIADKTKTVDSQELSGSPFRVCPHCGKTYFDADYHEIAITIFNERNTPVGVGWVLKALLFNGIGAFYTILCVKELLSNGYSEVGIGPILLSLLLICVAIFVDSDILKDIKNRRSATNYPIDLLEGRAYGYTNEIASSMARLSSRSYLDSLKAFGVSVPKYFYDRLDTINEVSNGISMPSSLKTVDASMVQFSSDANDEATETQMDHKNDADAGNNLAQKEQIINENDITKNIEANSVNDNKELKDIKFCFKCGSEIGPGAVFCKKCGSRVR